MSKLKNKSSAKKRFKILSSRIIIRTKSNKRHNMITKNKKQIKRQMGTCSLCKSEISKILKFIPNKY